MESLEKYRNQFLKGDNTLLKELYIEIHSYVMHVLTNQKKCSLQDAEGYYNEAMIQFYESIRSGRITEVKSIKNYITGICVNLVRRERASKFKIEKKIDDIRLHLYNKTDYNTTKEHNELLLEKVKFKLSQLSDRCQRVIRAYYIDGLTMKEIANALELKSGDVAKTTKSRCFKSLIKSIKEETYESS